MPTTGPLTHTMTQWPQYTRLEDVPDGLLADRYERIRLLLQSSAARGIPLMQVRTGAVRSKAVPSDVVRGWLSYLAGLGVVTVTLEGRVTRYAATRSGVQRVNRGPPDPTDATIEPAEPQHDTTRAASTPPPPLPGVTGDSDPPPPPPRGTFRGFGAKVVGNVLGGGQFHVEREVGGGSEGPVVSGNGGEYVVGGGSKAPVLEYRVVSVRYGDGLEVWAVEESGSEGYVGNVTYGSYGEAVVAVSGLAWGSGLA